MIKFFFKQWAAWGSLLNFMAAAMEFVLALRLYSFPHVIYGAFSFYLGVWCWNRIKWQKIYYILA